VSRYREIPRSLVNPTKSTVATRRVLAGVTAANGVPSAITHGVPTTSHRTLKVTLHLPDNVSAHAGRFRLWMFDEVSQKWCVHTGSDFGGDSGDDYALTITCGTAHSNPSTRYVEIWGTQRAYLELMTSLDVALTNGADAWIAGSSF
jgi:hypothetical protein